VNPAQETPISLESGAIFENTLNPAQEVFPQPPDPRNNPNRCNLDARTCVGQCASSRASARPAAGPRTSLDVLLLPSSNALLSPAPAAPAQPLLLPGMPSFLALPAQPVPGLGLLLLSWRSGPPLGDPRRYCRCIDSHHAFILGRCPGTLTDIRNLAALGHGFALWEGLHGCLPNTQRVPSIRCFGIIPVTIIPVTTQPRWASSSTKRRCLGQTRCHFLQGSVDTEMEPARTRRRLDSGHRVLEEPPT
jgi:hypothetical protein